MIDKEQEKAYPVRTLHEFLYEINREWDRFKKGALISIGISTVLFVAFVLVLIKSIQVGFEASDIILETLLGGFLLYSIYLMSGQYRFFRRWEKRMTRLTMLEEKVMTDQLDEKAD